AHWNPDLVAFSRASLELLLARIPAAKPRPRYEVGRDLLACREIAIQSQQHKCVLLRVAPAPLSSVSQKSANYFGNEITRGLIRDEGVEYDGVGPAVRCQQQVVAVPVRGSEVGCTGRLFDSIVQVPAHCGNICRRGLVSGKHRQQPTDGFER